MSNIEYYYNDVWSKTLDIVSRSENINQETFDYYFTTSKLLSLDENGALIMVPEFINYAVLNSNSTIIENAIEEVTGKYYKVVVKEERKLQEEAVHEEAEPQIISRGVDPNYSFGNFIIGRSNIQAQSASLLVSNNLGLMYNPLFIYGNSGLGKTHLLNAIGNDVKHRNKNIHICYVSGLDFVEGVAKASKTNSLEAFKNSFIDIDLLLVDDIQFITGKPKTQEIFFSIFNSMVNNKKQICLTCDKLPSQIEGLEERIITRFNQGLTVNIEAPEFETSLSIVKMKINNGQNHNQDIDDDVIAFIASNFSQDVRSLEGAVNRLLFYKINFGGEGRVTLEFAREAFKDQVELGKNELTIKTIKKVVSDYYNLTVKQLISKARTSNIANARHICMYLCKKLLDTPYEEIGREFGGKDHSTVMSACRKIDDLVKTDTLYQKAVKEIEDKLNKN